jgi:hypothetical protein
LWPELAIQKTAMTNPMIVPAAEVGKRMKEKSQKIVLVGGGDAAMTTTTIPRPPDRETLVLWTRCTGTRTSSS